MNLEERVDFARRVRAFRGLRTMEELGQAFGVSDRCARSLCSGAGVSSLAAATQVATAMGLSSPYEVPGNHRRLRRADRRAFAEALRAAREAKGWSLSAAGAKIGVDGRGLAQWEQAMHTPRPDLLAATETALGVSLSHLLPALPGAAAGGTDA